MRTLWHTSCVAAGPDIVQQHGVTVYCYDVVADEYFADLLVEDVLLVETEDRQVTVKALNDAHRMQCTNYLKATYLKATGLRLLNFGGPRQTRGQRPTDHTGSSAGSVCISVLICV